MRPAAFFDLDRTLISGASGFYWSRAAAKAGLIQRRVLAEHAYRNIRFRMSGSTDAATDRVMKQLTDIIRGKRVSEFERLNPSVVAAVMPRLYPTVLELARQHQRAGRPIYIVSAATHDTVSLIAQQLGFDGALGTKLEKVDGLYTGELDGPFSYREGKVEGMRALAEAESLSLAESYGYSDSESDLPMLRAVGIPIAVNPDKELERVALAEGWEIIRASRRGRRGEPASPTRNAPDPQA
jgi:HAD superfamily hydrolase (TIGR01490 family)